MIDESSILQGSLILLLLLQIKHFLADFVWQTDLMIQEKGIYGARHGLYHSGIHAAGTFVIFSFLHPTVGLMCAVIDFALHYHIDWAKVNINKRYNYTTKDHKFWVWLGLDQLLHQITYLILIGWVFFAF